MAMVSLFINHSFAFAFIEKMLRGLQKRLTDYEQSVVGNLYEIFSKLLCQHLLAFWTGTEAE
jgi:hypothetical protein